MNEENYFHGMDAEVHIDEDIMTVISAEPLPGFTGDQELALNHLGQVWGCRKISRFDDAYRYTFEAKPDPITDTLS